MHQSKLFAALMTVCITETAAQGPDSEKVPLCQSGLAAKRSQRHRVGQTALQPTAGGVVKSANVIKA